MTPHDACCVDLSTAHGNIAVAINPEARVSAVLISLPHAVAAQTWGSLSIDVQNNGFVTSPLTIDIAADNASFDFEWDDQPLSGNALEERELRYRSPTEGWSWLRLRFRATHAPGDLDRRDEVQLEVRVAGLDDARLPPICAHESAVIGREVELCRRESVPAPAAGAAWRAP